MEFDGATLKTRWAYSDITDEPLGYETYAATTAPGSGTAFELYADRQGSITMSVDSATGTIAASYAYDSFGRPVTLPVAGLFYGYTGREYDAESGFYHLRWRTYDPATGLFLQMDPLGFGGGQGNLYAYANGNPVMASDPMGLTEYFGYKSMIHGRYQTLGSATSAVSSGAFTAVQNMILGMGNWANYNLSPQSTGSMSNPSNGGRPHGNHGCNEGGQHVYVVYETVAGKTIKVGIGKEKDEVGSMSLRAKRQYPKLFATLKAKGWPGTIKDLGNTIVLKVPGGFMARAQALILEKLMVQFLVGSTGWIIDQDLHNRPSPDPFSSEEWTDDPCK